MRRNRWVVLLPLIAAQHFGAPAPTPDDAALRDAPAPKAAPQLTVDLLGIDADSLPGATPSISIRVRRDAGDPAPVALGVRVSTNSLVLDRFILDTSVLAVDSAEIRLTKALPSGATLFFRSYARTAAGDIVLSAPSPPRFVPQWLTLISPNATAGAILEDKQPKFEWTSARVSTPPGPWVYGFSILNTATVTTVYSTQTFDTTVTVPFPLEFSTSYRWSLTATLQNSPVDRVTGTSSFVIVNPAVPPVTLLYQTFPNPFPGSTVQVACVWFDLAERAQVTIEVLDIRSFLVRRIFPAGGGAAVFLEPGRYGRSAGQSGCNQEFTWDGTDDRGRRVIAGVYLLRLRAGGRQFIKQIVFRG